MAEISPRTDALKTPLHPDGLARRVYPFGHNRAKRESPVMLEAAEG